MDLSSAELFIKREQLKVEEVDISDSSDNDVHVLGFMPSSKDILKNINSFISVDPTSGLDIPLPNKVENGMNMYCCSQCDYCSIYASCIKRHLLSHTDIKPFSCRICGFKCSSRTNIKTHIYTHAGVKPYKCTECAYRCTRSRTLRNHIKLHSKNCKDDCVLEDRKKPENFPKTIEIIPALKPFYCTVCNFKSLDLLTIKMHTYTHVSDTGKDCLSQVETCSCTLCDYESSGTDGLEIHICSNRLFDCIECGLSFSNETFLMHHIKMHIEEAARNNCQNIHLESHKNLICNVCDYACVDSLDLEKHLKSNVHELNFSNEDSVEASFSYFKCPHCEYTCKYNRTLKKHIISHLEKQFACSMCAFKSVERRHLKVHILKQHCEKRFTCSVCSKKFKWHSELKRHVETHGDSKIYHCLYCNYSGKQLHNLVNHTKMHQSMNLHLCKHCEYKCDSLKCSQFHARTHTGEKSYSCFACEFNCPKHGKLLTFNEDSGDQETVSCVLCKCNFVINR